MKVRLRTLLASPDGCAQPGEVIEVTAATGEALVAGGFADAIGAAPAAPSEPAEADRSETVETTTSAEAEGRETAVSRRGRKGGR